MLKIKRKDIPEFTLCTKYNGKHVFKKEILNKIQSNTYGHAHIDAPIYECIISFVSDKSICVDIGANIGLMTCYMFSRNASHVISIEPQYDLYDTLQQTIKLNNWKTKSTISNKCVCGDEKKKNLSVELGCRANNIHWGFRYDSAHHKQSTSIKSKTTFVHIEDMLKTFQHYYFIKLDTDNVDEEISLSIAKFIQNKKIKVDVLLCEFIDAKVGEILSSMGYSSYILPFRNWVQSPLYFEKTVSLKKIRKAVPIKKNKNWSDILKNVPHGMNFLFTL